MPLTHETYENLKSWQCGYLQLQTFVLYISIKLPFFLSKNFYSVQTHFILLTVCLQPIGIAVQHAFYRTGQTIYMEAA